MSKVSYIFAGNRVKVEEIFIEVHSKYLKEGFRDYSVNNTTTTPLYWMTLPDNSRHVLIYENGISFYSVKPEEVDKYINFINTMK